MNGVDIPDPYRWLEDQQSADTRAWINEQNAYTRDILDAIPGRDRLRAELEKLYRTDIETAPTVRAGRYFYARRAGRQEQASICMREGIDGPERVLVDPASLSPDGSVAAFAMNATPDGRMLAWGKRKGGEDEAEVYFFDVDRGKILSDHLPRGVYYSVFILPDKSGFLYSRRRAEGTRLLEHHFGKPFNTDAELFGRGIPDEKLIWFQFSEDGRFSAAFVNEGAGSAHSRVYFLDRATGRDFQPLITDVTAAFSGVFGSHTLFLRTSWNADNGRVLAIDLERPARKNWREVISASKDSVLLGVVPAGHKLLASFLQNVSSRIAILSADGKHDRDIPLPTIGSAYVVGDAGWDSQEVFYQFQSYAHPQTIYRLDLLTGKQSLWHKMNVPLDTESMSTSQVWYTSKDGTRVPMFLVSRKGTKADGNLPVLLEAYGGYGSASTPWFNPQVALWVQHGGVYAWPSIRGGGEFGEVHTRTETFQNPRINP